MTKTSKTVFTLLAIEVALTVYFFNSQPQCEPCLPNTPCPTCISEEQIITFWTGVIIGIVSVAYLIYINFQHHLTGASVPQDHLMPFKSAPIVSGISTAQLHKQQLQQFNLQ